MIRRVEAPPLAGPAGPLEAQLLVPEPSRPGAALLCHPHPQHGGTMHTKALYRAARALVDLGLPVLRFHFRGVGRSAGAFDGGPGERDDARAALAWLESSHAGVPLVVGGFSFGSWIGLDVGSRSPAVVALLGLAPPLALYDFGFLRGCPVRMHCIAGDRDPFCPAPELVALVTALGPHASCDILPGGEHLLTGQLDALGTAVQRFVAGTLGLDRDRL